MGGHPCCKSQRAASTPTPFEEKVMEKKQFVSLAVQTFTVSLIGLGLSPADLVFKEYREAKALDCSAWSPSGSSSTFYSCGGSAWHPPGSNSTFYSNGGSAWHPPGSNSTFYSNGGSSWHPPGSNSTFYSNGGSAWRPPGANSTFYSRGGSSWRPPGSSTTYYQGKKPGKPGKKKR